MPAAKILIVEDESIVAQDIRASLEQMGYEVCAVVASGEDALKVAEEHEPDLVLMDIALAGELTGIETAAEIRRRSKTPVVYLTAHTDDETLVRAGATEPFGYIVKPFGERDLKGGVEIAIYRARIEEERRRAEEALRASENELAVRNRIAHSFLTVSGDEAYGEVLRVFIDATGSRHGLFGYIDETGALVAQAGMNGADPECQMPDKDRVLVRDRWGGAWGRALLENKTICSEGDLHAPPGHFPLERELAAPISHEGEVIGVISVANKAAPYAERDRGLMEALAAYIAPILYARLQRDRQSQARRQAEDALKNLRRHLASKHSFAGIVGRDAKMIELFESIRELAQVDASVLIQGESGTGKELVAMAIHSEGPRAEKPFIPVNCGALPETLLESELFGHVRGAFSGAVRDSKGRFELANGGTIFLDEVAEISMPMQVRLLRVLQQGTFERVGGEQTIKVDVRVISATNKDLRQLVKEQKFREDLFYRLCVVPVHMPPLRERTDDIPLLADHILGQLAKEARKDALALSEEALEMLMKYPWPGNVRELQNAIYYACVKARGETLEVAHFPPAISGGAKTIPLGVKRGRKPKLSPQIVKRTLEELKGNRTEAARSLGITRTTLYRYLEAPDQVE